MGCNNILLLYGIMVNMTGTGRPIHVLVLPAPLGYYAFLPQFLRKHESRTPVIADDRPPCYRRPLQNSGVSPGRSYLLRHSREACPVLLRYGDGNLKPFFQGIAALQPAFLDSCFRRALNNPRFGATTPVVTPVQTGGWIHISSATRDLEISQLVFCIPGTYVGYWYSRSEMSARSVFRGRVRRIRPMAFSTPPFCQGEWVSQRRSGCRGHGVGDALRTQCRYRR